MGWDIIFITTPNCTSWIEEVWSSRKEGAEKFQAHIWAQQESSGQEVGPTNGRHRMGMNRTPVTKDEYARAMDLFQ